MKINEYSIVALLLYCYIFSIQFDSLTFAESTSIPKIFGILLAIAFIFLLALHFDYLIKLKAKYDIIVLLVIALAIYSLSSLFSVSISTSVEKGIIILQLLISSIITILLCSENRKILVNSIVAFIASSVVIYIISLYKAISIGYLNYRISAFGTTGEEAHYGIGLTISYSFLLILLKNRKYTIAKTILICNMLIGIILSQTRSCWVVVIIISILNTLQNRKKLSFSRLLLIMAILLMCANYGSTILNIELSDVIKNRSSIAVETGGAGRTAIWKNGIRLFLKKPVLGFGFGTFNEVFSGKYVGDSLSFLDENSSSHNIYLSILVENGIVGMLLFMTSLTTFWLYIRNSTDSREKDLAINAALSLLIIGFFINITYKKYSWFVLSILLGILNYNNVSKGNNAPHKEAL